MATNETQQYKIHYYSRLTDVAKETLEMLPPIQGLENIPLVSLEQAIEPLIRILPDIQIYANFVKQGLKIPPHGLSTDESIAISLYSMDWESVDNSLYAALNTILRTKDRRQLRPWLLFLKLFITALHKLPSMKCHIFRGTKSDLHALYQTGKKVVWQGFASCTTSVNALESEQAMGKTGPRTLFAIECYTGKNIGTFSSNNHEDEILLLPGTQFEVLTCLNVASNIHIIQLKEVPPQFLLLESVACTKSKSIPIPGK